MSDNVLESKLWKLGTASADVACSTNSAVAAAATSHLASSNTAPRRKFLSITNIGSKWVFVGVGRTPTSTAYDFALQPISGTIDTNYVAGGTVWWDSAVPQEAINVITANSTSTVAVLVGV